MNNNDKFKLITRRYIALGFGGLATATLCFIVIWSLLCETGCREMAMAALGGLIAIVMGVVNTYLGKKVKEE